MIAANSDWPEQIIELRGLTRKYGQKLALDNVSMSVPRGVVVGLVGANGAGKTTLIRHVLGLLKAQQGTVRVFGVDPVADPVSVLPRIGYLSEENDLPGWMRMDELMRYTRAFYPNWDEAYAQELRGQFALNPSTKIKHLSKGQRARAGLLIALAYRPQLLLLDEPSSGLDPIVRREILGAIVRTIADEGRTVLFSSHLLDEVERVSDYIVMLRGGKIAFAGALDEIKESHCRLVLRFQEPLSRPPLVDGVLTWEGSGNEWMAVANGEPNDYALIAATSGGHIVAQQAMTLDEIFLARVSAPQASSVDY